MSESKKILDLIERGQAGEEEALSELVQIYQKDIFKFCYMMCHSYVMAQDLSQETFFKLLKNINKLEKIENLRNWLFKCAKNLYLDQIKSSYYKNSVNEIDEICNEAELNELTDEEFMSNMALIFAQLKVDDRLILLLIDLEKYTYAEAAEFIGISEDAVRNRIHRARKAFLEIFNETNDYAKSS
jgi:RNA polymerase sigma-70 factor (ECF subfamily)